MSDHFFIAIRCLTTDKHLLFRHFKLIDFHYFLLDKFHIFVFLSFRINDIEAKLQQTQATNGQMKKDVKQLKDVRIIFYCFLVVETNRTLFIENFSFASRNWKTSIFSYTTAKFDVTIWRKTMTNYWNSYAYSAKNLNKQKLTMQKYGRKSF